MKNDGSRDSLQNNEILNGQGVNNRYMIIKNPMRELFEQTAAFRDELKNLKDKIAGLTSFSD